MNFCRGQDCSGERSEQSCSAFLLGSDDGIKGKSEQHTPCPVGLTYQSEPQVKV